MIAADSGIETNSVFLAILLVILCFNWDYRLFCDRRVYMQCWINLEVKACTCFWTWLHTYMYMYTIMERGGERKRSSCYIMCILGQCKCAFVVHFHCVILSFSFPIFSCCFFSLSRCELIHLARLTHPSSHHGFEQRWWACAVICISTTKAISLVTITRCIINMYCNKYTVTRP